jgi:hypothetical protein
MAKTKPVREKPLIVGLQPAESMPIEFDGRRFDLANLSAEDEAFLRQYPDQVPYLATDNSQSNG